ncbi:hypothetical protein N6H18_06840 [Reichenbachiella agarivorans]|uniref:Uncharacterized protein n=1 Tax=Reichenbachiella agarivorans TaxID=2979464 RepID=A0ABY6CW32_9BACT|nr:hypothetical protein [Reichenbachiella agarivorans]UXP33668.1 hypothetical protein N6H18_06840 [Reichenbachiella agarivorans]
MEKLTLIVKDESKLMLLVNFLKELDFVDVERVKKKAEKRATHDIFSSAGMWSGRDIDAKELREKAWKRRG